MDQTEPRGQRWSAAALLLPFVPLAYLPWLGLEYLGRPLGSLDEPLLYVGARAMRHGAWPHIDFSSVYPPLNYVPVAATFALFGETALAARATQIAAYWLLVGALGAWFVSLGARGARLAVLMGATLALSAALPIQVSVFGVALGMLSLLAYVRGLALPTGRVRAAWMVGAGLCAALALFTRVSFGLYSAAAFGVDQAIELWRARGAGGRGRRQLAADALPLWSSAAVVAVAIAWVYGEQLRDMFEQSVTALLRALDRYAYAGPTLEPSLRGAVRWLTRGWWLLAVPLGWLGWRADDERARARAWAGVGLVLAAELGLAAVWPAALPLLAAPVAAAIVYEGALRQRMVQLERGELVALLAVCFFAHYYLSRTDLSHQLASTIPLVLLMPSVLPAKGPPAKGPPAKGLPASPEHARRRPDGWVLAAFALALAWPSFWSSHPTTAGVRAGLALLREGTTTSDAARLAGAPALPAPALAAIYPDATESAVARAVRERTREGEPVYVGVSDHARSPISNLRLLWLLGRPLGARHYLLLGEISNTTGAQQSIVSDLEARGVRWAVTWRSPDDGSATLARPLEPGPRLVDDYLSSRFRVTETLGDFSVLERLP